jgi:hypothetical protein
LIKNVKSIGDTFVNVTGALGSIVTSKFFEEFLEQVSTVTGFWGGGIASMKNKGIVDLWNPLRYGENLSDFLEGAQKGVDSGKVRQRQKKAVRDLAKSRIKKGRVLEGGFTQSEIESVSRSIQAKLRPDFLIDVTQKLVADMGKKMEIANKLAKANEQNTKSTKDAIIKGQTNKPVGQPALKR